MFLFFFCSELKVQSFFSFFQALNCKALPLHWREGNSANQFWKGNNLKDLKARVFSYSLKKGPEHYIVSCNLVVKTHFCSSLLIFQWNVGVMVGGGVEGGQGWTVQRQLNRMIFCTLPNCFSTDTFPIKIFILVPLLKVTFPFACKSFKCWCFLVFRCHRCCRHDVNLAKIWLTNFSKSWVVFFQHIFLSILVQY